MQDAQGWRQAMEGAFKNYMITIPHRIELGTYGPAAREKAPKDRFCGTQQEVVMASPRRLARCPRVQIML